MPVSYNSHAHAHIEISTDPPHGQRCKWHGSGCSWSSFADKASGAEAKAAHEAECSYRDCACGIDGCTHMASPEVIGWEVYSHGS